MFSALEAYCLFGPKHTHKPQKMVEAEIKEYEFQHYLIPVFSGSNGFGKQDPGFKILLWRQSLRKQSNLLNHQGVQYKTPGLTEPSVMATG